MKITFGVSLGSPLVQQQPTREKEKRKGKKSEAHTQTPRARNARTHAEEGKRSVGGEVFFLLLLLHFTSRGATLPSHPFCGRSSAPNSVVMRTAPPPGCRSARSVKTTHGKNHGHKCARADKKTWIRGRKKGDNYPSSSGTNSGRKTHKASTRILSTRKAHFAKSAYARVL